jgi:hypothetical protein
VVKAPTTVDFKAPSVPQGVIGIGRMSLSPPLFFCNLEPVKRILERWP